MCRNVLRIYYSYYLYTTAERKDMLFYTMIKCINMISILSKNVIISRKIDL